MKITTQNFPKFMLVTPEFPSRGSSPVSPRIKTNSAIMQRLDFEHWAALSAQLIVCPLIMVMTDVNIDASLCELFVSASCHCAVQTVSSLQGGRVQFKSTCPVEVSHLDHLVLTVKNVPDTIQFYTSVLGMEVVTFKVSQRHFCFLRISYLFFSFPPITLVLTEPHR